MFFERKEGGVASLKSDAAYSRIYENLQIYARKSCPESLAAVGLRGSGYVLLRPKIRPITSQNLSLLRPVPCVLLRPVSGVLFCGFASQNKGIYIIFQRVIPHDNSI